MDNKWRSRWIKSGMTLLSVGNWLTRLMVRWWLPISSTLTNIWKDLYRGKTWHWRVTRIQIGKNGKNHDQPLIDTSTILNKYTYFILSNHLLRGISDDWSSDAPKERGSNISEQDGCRLIKYFKGKDQPWKEVSHILWDLLLIKLILSSHTKCLTREEPWGFNIF